jgi:hypothetical protein
MGSGFSAMVSNSRGDTSFGARVQAPVAVAAQVEHRMWAYLAICQPPQRMVAMHGTRASA